MQRNLIGGVAIGAAATLLIHILHFAGLIRSELGAYLLMLVLVVHALVLGFVFRGHRRDGQGRFMQLLGAGMLISLLAGLVGAGGSFLFTEVTDPDYLPWLQEESFRRLEASPLPAAEKDLQRVRIEEGVRQPEYAFQSITGSMVFGLMLSFLLAILLRQRD